MKDLIVLHTPSEVNAYVRNLWQSDSFRRSHDAEDGFIRGIIGQFSKRPRIFYDMTDKWRETAHMSIWWNCIAHRQYDNPAVHDLYFLHEFIHAIDLVYMPGMVFDNFRQKMFDNEQVASVYSEILAYFAMPDLREQTFKHEIFADRFLKDPKRQREWQENPERLVRELALKRRNATLSPNPDDQVEYWMGKFAQQNSAWASIWSDRYDDVESAMAHFVTLCDTDHKEKAIKTHLEWLIAPHITQDTQIPFSDEAAAFAGVYWKNKAMCCKMAQQQPREGIAAAA